MICGLIREEKHAISASTIRIMSVPSPTQDSIDSVETWVSIVSLNPKPWVLPPLSNSWIISIIWLYIALNRTLNRDCYWGGSTQSKPLIATLNYGHAFRLRNMRFLLCRIFLHFSLLVEFCFMVTIDYSFLPTRVSFKKLCLQQNPNITPGETLSNPYVSPTESLVPSTHQTPLEAERAATAAGLDEKEVSKLLYLEGQGVFVSRLIIRIKRITVLTNLLSPPRPSK